MLLAIDIGNSNITLGGIQEGEILFEARLATDSTKTSDEYGVEIKDMLDLFGARVEEIRDCIVASVVPPVFISVRNGIVKLTGKEPMVVGPGIKTGINILLEDPGATGADLIAAAVAAVDTYPTRPPPSRSSTTGTPSWAGLCCQACASPQRPCPAGPPSCRASSWNGPGGPLGRTLWSACRAA